MNSFYKLTDLNNQAVWINLQAVTAIIIPSLLDTKNVQSQIVLGQIAFLVNESEARKLLNQAEMNAPL